MADPVVSYPFDPTGQASTNRITGELISVIPPGDRLFHYAMPKFAPFFEEGLVVKLRDLGNNVITLTKGVDYYLSHKFMDASLATMHPIWGSISFLRRDIAGTLIVDYNTLGGIWTIDSALITEILVNTIRNPRITSWEQVVERPVDFPVIDHMWNLDDMVGQKEILEVLQNFYTAYLVSLDPDSEGGGGGVIAQHIQNFANPHKVTAAQVGAYSILQTDTKLAEYVTKTGTAANSAKLENKSLAEIIAQLVATKVDSAKRADEVDHANTATTADNSGKLGGKTLTEIMQDVASASVGDAAKFNGKTYAEVVTDIRNGKAADSAKLEGKTLAEIIQQLQQSTGDAVSLQGKTLEALMNDVKNTKVVAAGEADMAADSRLLNGKSLNDILSTVAGTVPNNAENANRVYGYTFEALIGAILESDTWANSQLSGADMYPVEGFPVLALNDGGTQDAAYTYGMLGEYPIPLTGTSNDKYDPTAKRYSDSIEIILNFAQQTLRTSLVMTIGDDQSLKLDYFSPQDLGDAIRFGIRNVDSTIKSADGTKTAKFAQVYFKFKKSATLRRYGAFHFIKNSFWLGSPDEPVYWDHTNVVLNSVVWKNPSLPAGVAYQAIFDDLADDIAELLATPAA